MKCPNHYILHYVDVQVIQDIDIFTVFVFFYEWHYLIHIAKWVDITNLYKLINIHTLVLLRALKLRLGTLDIP